MSNYNNLKSSINNNIYENQTQQITGTVLNAILNEMTNALGAGYQFAGVATVGMTPSEPDARIFYLAGEGIYTSFDGIQVPAGKLGILKWDNRWHLETIDGLGSGGANLTGYVTVASTDDLPDEGVATLGYLCGENLYLYVGEGGDTKEGKYQNCGSFRGPQGDSVQDVEQTQTSLENGGVNKIKFTLSNGISCEFQVRNGTTSSGLFPTLAALQAAYPSPVVGQYAFVGAGFPADIYVCTTAGTWTDSGEDYDGDNVDLTDYATKEEVSQLQQKLIKLTGFGASGVAGGVTAIGDVFYNTSSKLLRKLVSGTPNNGVYDTVPYYDGAIYTCGGKIYIWNGVELLESASDRILKDYNIFPLCGFGIDSARGGVTKAGDVFYNTTTNLLRRCLTYTNPYTGTYETVPFDSNILYLNLSDNCLYQYNGGTMVLLQDTSFYKSNHIIHLNNIGSGWNPNTQVVRLGEVYFNSETKKLRMCVGKNAYGGENKSVDVPLYYDALYVFNGAFYKWNGEDLIVVPISSATFSASSSVLMYPGVSCGNGNIWALVNASIPTEVGTKYGNGFFSVELVEVAFGDVLEIDYTKMGIDGTKYKIGIIEYDENGKYFGPDGRGSNSEPTYYLQDSLVSFQERTKYIRLTVHQLDTSTYELQSEFRMPIFFTKYSSNLVKLVKDFVSNGSNITPAFPYVKGITYPVENTNVVFNNTASLTYKDKSIGFNNGYAIFPEEYTPHGKGFPLILFIHGTEGIDFVNATSPLYLDLLKNVAKGGYIVADCSSLSSFYYNNDEGTTKTIVDANYPEPIAWECYHKLFLYLTRRWNIDESRVYVFGKSAGGMNTIMLSQMGLLPIKAAANLAGSIDVITNMRVMASGPNNINPFLHRIGMTDANLSGQIVGTGDADYLVSHIQDLAGFNPLWFKTVGLDKETQIRRCIADGLNTSAIENDTALQNAVSAASTSLRIPIKWWQAVDDVNVPIGTTRMYQKMVRNGGGIFEIREFPAGCGAHHAVDNASNAPTTSYTHRNGVTVTLPVAYAEVLDWFNLWW